LELKLKEFYQPKETLLDKHFSKVGNLEIWENFLTNYWGGLG